MPMRGHREGTRRPDGRWMFRRTVDGKKLCVVQKKGESKRQAQERLERLAYESKKEPGRQATSVARCAERFLEYRRSLSIAERTLEDDVADAGLLTSSLGHVQIGGLDKVAVDLALAFWTRQGKLRTAKKLRDFGRKMFNWCKGQRWVAGDNPFALSKPTGYQPDQWEEPMRQADYEKALANVETAQMQAMFALLRGTGQRPTAVRMLTWFEVEDGEILRIRKRPGSKGSKNRAGTKRIVVPEPAASMLRSLPRTSEYVFPSSSKRGKPYWSERYVLDVWYRALDKAGLERRPVYCLKHMRATELARSLDRHLAADAMGLKSPEVLERYYLQIEREELDRKVSEIGSVKQV